jgi:hypothetical protein
MPTPSSKGNTAFRDISVESETSLGGVASVTVTKRGAASLLAAEVKKYKLGSQSSSYGSGFLQSISWRENGPVADLVLIYQGSLAKQDNAVNIFDDIAEESVTITTSTDENVNFRYFSQTTTYSYIATGSAPPTRPKYPAIVPSSLPVGFLRQPNPPNYTGSISGAYKLEGILVAFQRNRLTDNSWEITESWKNLVEPINPNS